MGELKLMKGNEAIAEAAIRAGVDAYFGYPITPQSEVMEYLMAEKPYETTGMVVLQAESEVAAINMVYGAAGTGKKVMTSSSSPGISLKHGRYLIYGRCRTAMRHSECSPWRARFGNDPTLTGRLFPGS